MKECLVRFGGRNNKNQSFYRSHADFKCDKNEITIKVNALESFLFTAGRHVHL